MSDSSNQAQEVLAFITNLLNSDLDEVHDLLVNHGEDIELKASETVAALRAFHPRERDAMLAGLRMLQQAVEDGQPLPADITMIYTNEGRNEGLSPFWLENLCQRINHE